MIDVFGACKCGSVFWISGEFELDESGCADVEWECEICGESVPLYAEQKGAAV